MVFALVDARLRKTTRNDLPPAEELGMARVGGGGGGPDEAGDSLTALIRPAEALRVHWDQDSADAIVRGSGGSPFLLQLCADAAWRHGGPRPGGRIESSAAAAGVAEAERLL